MATLRKQIALEADAAKVWSALRDFGAVHTRVAPGFLTKLDMDKADRMVTFFNGMVARERLVTLDDAECRLVWTVDLLPDELAPAIGGMMDHAVGFMKKTLDAA